METRAMLSAMWRSRTGPILVAAQVAITLAVLVNVAYIIQVRVDNISQPTGLDLPNIFWATTQAYSPEYNNLAAIPADLDYLQSLPGVKAVSTTTLIPQNWSSMSLPFSPDPAVLEKGGGQPSLVYFGSAQLIETLGLKLVAGRSFDPAAVVPQVKERAELLERWPGEIVITKNLADKLWPKGDALGKILHAGLVNKSGAVVGIVDFMQHRPVAGPAAEMFRTIVFVPATGAGNNGANYLVRTEPGRRDATMATVEKELAEKQPGRYLASMEALEQTARRMRADWRKNIVTLAVVGFFVLAVTTVGIVGLAAFTVATRTKQLGTRRAIGATKFHILRYFLIENWLITSVGAALGCALALAVGVELSLMYQMPRLPLYYLLGGVVALWAVGLLAVLFPARRAASISPATATRTL
jgi:putative ABC transport system permease protein